METFKVGDEVEVVARCGLIIPNVSYVVFEKLDGTLAIGDNRESDNIETCSCYSDWRLIKTNKKSFMKTITTIAKKLLDSDTQALIKAGYIDSCLELTTPGKEEIQAIQFETYKAELVVRANAKIEEENKK